MTDVAHRSAFGQMADRAGSRRTLGADTPPYIWLQFLTQNRLDDIFELQRFDTVALIGSALSRSVPPVGEHIVAETYRQIEVEIPRLRRYARALTRDVCAADDLVQDSLTRALGKLHLWQNGTDLRAWLFTILHNQYVNYVRRSVREGAAVGLNDNEPMLRRAPHQGHRLELRDLERAIAKLPEEQRSAILLVGLEGMRYEEVAAVLGVPVGTVRSRLSRAREALRKLIGADPTADYLPKGASGALAAEQLQKSSREHVVVNRAHAVLVLDPPSANSVGATRQAGSHRARSAARSARRRRG
jgi:RNA polymerase sigma-70 factor, ECF subfamily